MSDEYIQDDELVEAEEGPENLAIHAARFREAHEQAKKWLAIKAREGKHLERWQETWPAAYEAGDTKLIVKMVGASHQAKLDVENLLHAEELTTAELQILVLAATGFRFEAIDAGCKGNNPIAWVPTTYLGAWVRQHSARVPFRAGYLSVDTALLRAEE